jgi:hypothetical protein
MPRVNVEAPGAGKLGHAGRRRTLNRMSYRLTREGDPHIGLNDPRRAEGESIDEALISKAERRNRTIRRRMIELKSEFGDQLPDVPPAA